MCLVTAASVVKHSRMGAPGGASAPSARRWSGRAKASKPAASAAPHASLIVGQSLVAGTAAAKRTAMERVLTGDVPRRQRRVALGADEPVPHRRLVGEALVAADAVPRIRHAADPHALEAGLPESALELERVEELLRACALAVRRMHEVVLVALEDAARPAARDDGAVKPPLALVDQEAL